MVTSDRDYPFGELCELKMITNGIETIMDHTQYKSLIQRISPTQAKIKIVKKIDNSQPMIPPYSSCKFKILSNTPAPVCSLKN